MSLLNLPDIIPDWFDPWFSTLFTRETTTPSFVIRKLGINKDIIYRALASGELESMRPFGRWIIPKPALKAWMIKNYTLNK